MEALKTETLYDCFVSLKLFLHALRNYMKDTPYWDERPDKEGSAVVTTGGTAFFNCSSSA